MSDRIRSGIDFNGPRIRYCEVEEGRSGLKLLRLGSCDFDFDAEEAVLSGLSRSLETVGEAVGDVFSGSRSTDVSVVLSPASVISFFSPVSNRVTDEEKQHQLEVDTMILGGRSGALSVVAEPVSSEVGGDEESVTWYHVAAVPTSVRHHLSSVLTRFDGAAHHFVTSMQAAARVAGRIEARAARSTAGAGAAVVGLFASHIEIALLRSSQWLAGATFPATHPSDLAYAILNLAGRANIDASTIGRVHLYGDALQDSAVASVEAVVAADVQRMNPLELVQGGPAEEPEDFDPSDYVSCVGATL